MDRHFTTFMLFMSGLTAVVLTGLTAWISDGIGKMEFGDAGTWFSGLATTAVAVLAWRTARDAARTARATHANELAREASNVTWWFEENFYSGDVSRDPDIRAFMPPENTYPWELGSPQESTVSRVAIVRVQNNNAGLVGEAQLRMNDRSVDQIHAGLQTLGILRPGVTRYWATIAQAGGSSGAAFLAWQGLGENRYASWLQFTDSGGHRWRRHADGTLEPQDQELRRFIYRAPR